MEDRAGGIWVSSEYTGISRLSVLNEGAERVFPEDETLSDRSNTVRMINRMPDDKIWLGTRQYSIRFHGYPTKYYHQPLPQQHKC